MNKENNLKKILEQFRDCIPLFNVLSDELRQNIIMVLAEEEKGLNVNMITEKMTLSRPAISHHLKVLKQAGIVGSEKGYRKSLFSNIKRAN